MQPKTKVLIADDEEQILEFLGELLEYFDFEVIKAENGAVAWEKFQENPDLSIAITDNSMPKLSGTELIKKIKMQRPDFPVIMITAYSHNRDAFVNKTHEYPPDGYLEKPFDIMSLIDIIKEVMPGLKI